MAGKDLFILNGLHKNKYTEELIAGKPAYTHCIERVQKHFKDVVILVNDSTDFGLPSLTIEKEDVYGSFSALIKEYPGFENYIFGDLYTPFLEAELGGEFADLNREQIAHYTYGEHYPRGVAPQVLSAEALTILCNVASGNNFPMNDEAIYDLMGININNYDIEIEVSEHDFRRYRLDFRSRSHMQAFLLKKLADEMGRSPADTSYEALSTFLLNNPNQLRTLPAYIEIDLSENCNLACSFCPREKMGLSGKENGNNMSLKNAVLLAEKIVEFNPEAVTALSPYCEPMIHPDFRKILSTFIEAGLKVVIETNGTRLTSEEINFFASFPEEKLIVIVSLDVLKAEEFEKYKKKDLYENVLQGLNSLLEKKQRNVYIQVLNMKELSETVDDFYDFWNAHEDRVLPRKYNSFSGQLPDENAVDLSPLKRFPCWHLKRDMVIRFDGGVYLCKQDILGKNGMGNVFKDGLQAAWEKLGKAYETHLDGKWGHELCEACDEWYTYNF